MSTDGPHGVLGSPGHAGSLPGSGSSDAAGRPEAAHATGMAGPRANLPFTGIATFARAPYVQAEVLQPGDAHFAVLGVPFDGAVGYRPGQRLAPRAIRDLSTRYALPWGAGNPGYWDIQDDQWYLAGCRLVDVGDADPLYTDLEHLDRSVASLVGAITRARAIPVVLGGDHSITYPVLRALAPCFAPGGIYTGRRLHILQIDAHLDFTDTVAGFARSNSSPFRRAAELPFVGTITVVGVRGIRTNPEAYAAAVQRGNRIVTMHELRRAGIDAVLEHLPRGEPLYVSLDIDGLDPAIAPGTSSPEPSGLTYDEVRAILRAAAGIGRIVGLDVVEVNPYLDPGGATSLLAARLVIEAMAFAYDGERTSAGKPGHGKSTLTP